MALNQREVYIIQGMLADGKTRDEIMDFLKNKKPLEVDECINTIQQNSETPLVKPQVDDNLGGILKRLQELGVQADTVLDIIESIDDKSSKTVEQIKDEVVEKSTTGKLMKQTSDKGNRGVTAMTGPASERGDDFRSRHKSRQAGYLFKRT